MLKIATVILPLAILSTAAMAQQDSTGAAGNSSNSAGTTRANGGTEATPQSPNGNPKVVRRNGRLGPSSSTPAAEGGMRQQGATGSTSGQSSPSTNPQ